MLWLVAENRTYFIRESLQRQEIKSNTLLRMKVGGKERRGEEGMQ